jgi:hypothetical protein
LLKYYSTWTLFSEVLELPSSDRVLFYSFVDPLSLWWDRPTTHRTSLYLVVQEVYGRKTEIWETTIFLSKEARESRHGTINEARGGMSRSARIRMSKTADLKTRAYRSTATAGTYRLVCYMDDVCVARRAFSSPCSK